MTFNGHWTRRAMACRSARQMPGIASAALILTTVSLISCAATENNAFLGPRYDGPTAAYGYNPP